jgi:hypothetical protein
MAGTPISTTVLSKAPPTSGDPGDPAMSGKPGVQTVLRTFQAGLFNEQEREFKCLAPPLAAMGSALRSATPRHGWHFGQTASATSTGGTCGNAIVAASSRISSPSDGRFGVADGQSHAGREARPEC